MDDRYMAGLFDGEGYVRISRWKKPNTDHVRYQIFAGIGMTHLPIIEQIHETYGGSLHMNRHDKKNPNYKIQFSCIFASQKAATFLRHILPYTVVKSGQIKVALELQDHIDNTPYKRTKIRGALRENHDEILTYREKLFHHIISLRKRRYLAFTD